MGRIYDNFMSWWQKLMLIIGQPEKMLTELKKVNEAGSYLLRQWTVWSMVIIIVSKSCVFTLYVGVLGQGTTYSNVTASLLPPSSPHLLLWQPSPVGLSHHCLIQPSGSQYLHKSCSLSPVAL